MKEKIEARIQQLEQEHDDLVMAAKIRTSEIRGAIQSLHDVLVALEAEEKALQPA